MSYHRNQLALSGSVGPAWYRAMNGMGGVTSQPPGRRVVRQAMGGVTSQPPGRRVVRSLGSLGDDPTTTLSDPTVTDPADATGQWQAAVMAQLQAGVNTMKTAELQKWLQIVATVSIPLSAAIWKMILKKRGKLDPTT